MTRLSLTVAAVALAFVVQPALARTPQAPAPARWSADRANTWYAQQRWLVGSNFINSGAINPLEMWQADTFNPEQIDRELGYAEGIGMNTMRVFLHDQLWAQDPAGFKKRVDTFLTIAAKHHIKPILVLFDSCWDPYPHLGPQPAPIPGVHNSGWVQSPGAVGLKPENTPKLKAYVEGIVGAFANDDRILAWDVWNEPDNRDGQTNDWTVSGKAGAKDGGRSDQAQKVANVERLLPQVFTWARGQKPVQPLTSGVWLVTDDWSLKGKHSRTEEIQITQSDVISFHSYEWPEDLEKRIVTLKAYGRPLLLTEYMARGNGSTFDSALPLGEKYHVAMINWGFVVGKTQTNMPWDSWQRPYTANAPTLWFHDIFYADGKPYRPAETEQIRAATARAAADFAAQK
ncbi:1,4-beta-xylanase [Asticcacaulis solisilvae]|uniref:1,4-beta-xylanase n=1 Tax=Asticcacaulis solisilvae TaxID=1217274 RepID=UPI003FD7CE0A